MRRDYGWLTVLGQVVGLHRALLASLTRKGLPSEKGPSFAHGPRSLLLPFLVVVTLTTPMEALFLYLVIPAGFWWVRDLLMLVSIDAVLLMWGLHASVSRCPHVLAPEGFLIRWGLLVSYLLPYRAIATVAVRRDRQPSGQFGVTFHPKKPEAFVTNTQTTTISLTLRRPHLIPAWLVSLKPVTMIHLDVADPAGLAQGLLDRVREAARADTPPVSDEETDHEVTVGHRGFPLALLSMALEIPFFVVGVLWMQSQDIDWAAELWPSWAGLLEGTAIGLCGAGLTIAALVLAPRLPALAPWRMWVNESLVPFLGNPRPLTIALIATSAGLGEETLFRGAVQPMLGLIPTALVFATFHVGIPRRESLPLFGYSLVGGLCFGLLRYQLLLWPLVVAHAILDGGVMAYICRTRSLDDPEAEASSD